MTQETPRLTYPTGHWLRSQDPERVLEAGRRQQALTYSQVKNAFLFELLEPCPGQRVLDYGCGAGFFAVEAARRGAALVLGVDAEPTALGAATLLARQHGVDGRTAFVAADSVPLRPESRFDAVCLRDVLEHLPDALGMLQRLAALLRSGGRLILATQNAWSLNYVLEGGLRRLLLGQKDWMGWDPTHLRFYTPRTLRRLLLRAGLQPYAWRSAYVLPHKLPARRGSGRLWHRIECLARSDRLLGRIVPTRWLGWNIMVGARR